MGTPGEPPRIVFLILCSCVITVLVVRAGSMAWLHRYQEGAVWLGVALALIALFFRRRLFALFLCALCFILVNVVTSLPFHPSLAGAAIGVVALLILFAMWWWHDRAYPHLEAKDWQKIFDNDSPF